MTNSNKPRVTYLKDNDGLWWKTEWQPQCADEGFFYGKCQGVKGHKGCHWSYRSDGSYGYWVNEDDSDSIEEGVGAGSIPPDNEKYIHPKEKSEEYYLKFHTTTEVKDSTLIERLERDDAPEADASIDKPLTKEEVADLRKRGILPEE